MPQDIYDQHCAAFANVSAYVILDQEGKRVGTVAIKFPKAGAGRLYAYVHILGLPRVRGHANGYGYDKCSAAIASAATQVAVPTGNLPYRPDFAVIGEPADEAEAFHAHRVQACVIRDTLLDDNGEDWSNRLRDSGFTVMQAV